MEWSLRGVVTLLLFTCIICLTACGGKTDTNGSLTLSSPVSSDNNDGSYNVAVTTTFTPPAGKAPNGVVIHFIVTGNGVTLTSTDKTLTSAPTVEFGVRIPQSTSSLVVVITASVGDMESAVSVTIPALGTLSASPVQFLDTDPALTIKTSTISGGVPPYTLMSPNTNDLHASIVGGNSLSVTKISNIGSAPQLPVNFTIQDALGNLAIVQVTYFK